MRPSEALLRRTLFDARTRTLWFAVLLALYGLAQVVGYTRAYPNAADRLTLANNFGNDTALKLFYGTPHHIETVGGYAAWRVGGIITLAAAFFGLLSAMRAFRSEEESSRFEIVATGAITRRSAFAVRLAAIAVTIGVLWLAVALGVLAGGLSAGGSAFFALVVVAVACVYTGIGLVACQLMPTGSGVLQLGGAIFALDFLVRVIADIGNHPALHWLLPLGWAEEARAFTTPRPAVLLLSLIATVVLVLIAYALERQRDIGEAVFAPRDTARADRRLLGSSTLFAVRSQALSLAVWLAATAFFAIVVGSLAKSVISGLTPSLRQQLAKLGTSNLLTVEGVLGFYFIFFVVEIAAYCCVQIGAARGEEAQGRLETLFALSVDRVRWLGGRIALAAVGALLIALAAGLGAALGASASGASVSYAKLIGAGLNCLPACALFLGAAALLIALAPRQGVGLAYALVAVAFVWYLVGGLLGAPGWLLGLSPFDQIGFVPAASFRAGPAAVMLLIGLAAAGAALVLFRRRDLVGA